MPGIAVITHVEHLLDGEPVYVPYMSAGHHHREDPAGSPEVEMLLAVDDLAPHPFNGKQTALVRLVDGRRVVVTQERLAHTRSCRVCASIWERLEEELADLPEDAMVSAGMSVYTSLGPAMLLVDAVDLDQEEYVNEEDAE